MLWDSLDRILDLMYSQCIYMEAQYGYENTEVGQQLRTADP